MTLQSYCIACRYGRHEEHIAVPRPGTPGLIGSRHECPCKGECVKTNKQRVDENVAKIMEHYPAAPNPAAVHATLCQDCGAELGKPSDLMRHECPIGIARAIRLGNRGDISPSHLHALCRGDAGLYVHAMREAGYIVLKATGQPEDPCETCGWSPTNKEADQRG